MQNKSTGPGGFTKKHGVQNNKHTGAQIRKQNKSTGPKSERQKSRGGASKTNKYRGLAKLRGGVLSKFYISDLRPDARPANVPTTAKIGGNHIAKFPIDLAQQLFEADLKIHLLRRRRVYNLRARKVMPRAETSKTLRRACS